MNIVTAFGKEWRVEDNVTHLSIDIYGGHYVYAHTERPDATYMQEGEMDTLFFVSPESNRLGVLSKAKFTAWEDTL